MDTFMDKLSQKLTASEMIKANAEADAAELARMEKQNREYEQMLAGVRTSGEQIGSAADAVAESTKGLSACVDMLATGSEKIRDSADQFSASADHLAESATLASEAIQKTLQQSSEAASKMQDAAAEYRVAADEAVGKLKDAAEIVGIRAQEIKTFETGQEETNDLLQNLIRIMGEQNAQMTEHVHKESVKVYRNVQAIVEQESSKQTELLADISGKLRSIKGRSTAALVISIVAMGVSVLTLAFLAVQYFGLI